MKKLMCMAVVAMMMVSSIAMAGSVSGDVMVRPRLTHASTNTGSTATETLPTLVNDTFTNGTGALGMNQLYYATRTLASNSVEYLDLVGGVEDSFGAAVTLNKMRLIIVSAATNNTGNIAVGGSTNAPILTLFVASGDQTILPPSGMVMWYCPTVNAFTNFAGTSDNLMVSNSSVNAAATYSVYVGGSL